MQGSVHIVDDDMSFRTAMERRLKKAGYEVAIMLRPITSGSVADRKFPSCILLDVRDTWPGRPGPAVALRELGSKLPIIFLTGSPDIPTAVEAIKSGCR